MIVVIVYLTKDLRTDKKKAEGNYPIGDITKKQFVDIPNNQRLEQEHRTNKSKNQQIIPYAPRTQ